MADVTTAQPQMSTANQSPASSPDMSQISPQVAALMQQLSQLGGGMSMANGQVGNTQGQALPPQAQKSAQKALSDYYDQQAQSVLAHPHGIAALTAVANGQQQPPMSTPQGVNPAGAMALQGGQQQPNPQQVLSGILPKQGQPLGTNQVNNPQMLSPQNAFQNTSYNPQTGQIQEGGWANRGLRGLASGGLPGLLGGLLGPSLGAQMGATKEAQVLKAGQPAETTLPQAQAQEAKGRSDYFNSLSAQTNQLISRGGPPISPEMRAQYTNSINNLNMEQTSKLQDSLKDQIEANSKQLDDLEEKEPQLKKTLEHQAWYKKVQGAQDRVEKATILMGAVSDKLKNLKFKNPNTGNDLGNNNIITDEIRSKAPAGSSHFDPVSNNYYDAKGNILGNLNKG